MPGDLLDDGNGRCYKRVVGFLFLDNKFTPKSDKTTLKPDGDVLNKQLLEVSAMNRQTLKQEGEVQAKVRPLRWMFWPLWIYAGLLS